MVWYFNCDPNFKFQIFRGSVHTGGVLEFAEILITLAGKNIADTGHTWEQYLARIDVTHGTTETLQTRLTVSYLVLERFSVTKREKKTVTQCWNVIKTSVTDRKKPTNHGTYYSSDQVADLRFGELPLGHLVLVSTTQFTEIRGPASTESWHGFVIRKTWKFFV